MVAEKIEGAIVNMSSINAQVAEIPVHCRLLRLQGRRHAVDQISGTALAPHNIRVNAVGGELDRHGNDGEC